VVGARRAAPLLAALVLLSCGKKGDPSPPLPRGPRAVSDLSVEQEGGEAILTFSYPDRLLTGASLTDLASIEVYRVVGASPAVTQPVRAPAPSGARTDEAPVASARREAMAVRQAEESFYKEARLVAALPAASLGEHSLGASVIYRDDLLPLLEKGTTVPTLAYAVVSMRREGERSPLSNLVTLAPEVPPRAPVLGEVTAEEGRICLEWTPPEEDLLGRQSSPGGYFVYRRRLPQEEYERPINASPVTGTSYVDTTVAYGSSYMYTVRATIAGKPRLEGPPAAEAGIVYNDVYPPAAPPRLDALSEANVVRLVWDAAPSPDVVGYLVFRAEGDSPPVPLTRTPVADTFFTDSSVPPGRRYRYTVRAVDGAGNLGPASAEAVAEPF
jgi:hypothetical protein